MFLVWGIFNWFKKGLLGLLLDRYTPGEAGTAALIGGAFVFVVIFSYLIGSINCSLVLSRVVYHDDVRQHGSGNAGATNMTRTYGKKAGVIAFFGDGFKGVLCIVVASLIFGCSIEDPYYIFLVTAAYLAAFICVVGHVFPCFSHFHGGKGFATTALSIIALNPFIAGILCFIFFPLVALTRYISLGSIITALFYPVILSTFDGIVSHYGVSTLFAFLMAAIVTWAHRSNIQRLLAGTERKIKLGKKDKGKAQNSEETQ